MEQIALKLIKKKNRKHMKYTHKPMSLFIKLPLESRNGSISASKTDIEEKLE